MKIVVSAGASFGHIHPALAIIHKFQECEKNLEVLYIGTHNRMEKDIIPKEHIPYEEIEIYGFTKDMKRNIKNISCIHKSYKKCLSLLKEFQPDVVIGVGGYVTYPVIKAAHKLHMKTFLHEQNSIPGKSNKMLAKYADLIGITFMNSKEYFKTNKNIIYTGHPCGAEALKEPVLDKTILGFSRTKKLVIIVAGSLGSGTLNQKMKDYLMSIKNEVYEVLYITGQLHYDEFVDYNIFPSNVHIVPYMNHLSGFMKNADLVISRAGSGVLSELMALRIPAIIIPSPNVANNHQYYNALELSSKNAIIMMQESDLTPSLLTNEIRRVLFDKMVSYELKKNMKNISVDDSVTIIYDAIKDLIK